MIIDTPFKKQRLDENQQISFLAIDVDILENNSNNPIVISSIINNFLVERILIDDGSALEVLIYDALKKKGLDEKLLKLPGPIYGFATNRSR